MNNNYVIFDKASGRAVSSVFCQDTVLSLYTENGKYGHLQTPEASRCKFGKGCGW